MPYPKSNFDALRESVVTYGHSPLEPLGEYQRGSREVSVDVSAVQEPDERDRITVQRQPNSVVPEPNSDVPVAPSKFPDSFDLL